MKNMEIKKLGMKRLFKQSSEQIRGIGERTMRICFVLAACFVFGTAQAQPFGLSFQGVENGHADVTNVKCTTLGDVLVTLAASDATEAFHISFSADNYNLMFAHAPRLLCRRVASSQGLSWSQVGTNWALNLENVQLLCQPDVGSNQPKAAVLNLSGRLDCTRVIGSK